MPPDMERVRQIAWNRAKEELETVLCTYWRDPGKSARLDVLIAAFVNKIEEKTDLA